jgi:hypothetical protein
MRRTRSTPARARAVDNAKRCVELRLAGKEYREIGRIVGIDFACAYRHVAKYLQLAAQQALEGAEEIRQIELERLDGIYSRALEAWHRGIGEKKKIVEEQSQKDGQKTRTETEDLNGDPRYLQVMLDCQGRRAKLLGLDAPEKKDITSDGKPLFTDDERAKRIRALLTNGSDLGTDRSETPDPHP